MKNKWLKLTIPFDIVCLLLNALMVGFSIGLDANLDISIDFLYKTNVVLIVDYIKNNWVIWILGMILLFIVNLFCCRKKVLLILSIINIILSPIAFFLYAGTH